MQKHNLLGRDNKVIVKEVTSD